MPERTIFRQSAITAYKRGLEKDTLPRLISWPIIVCLWLLLAVLIAAAFLAWYVQVPTYADGPGVILVEEDTLQPAPGDTMAVVFLPPDRAAHLRVGLPVDVEIGSTGVHTRGIIARVASDIVSPEAAKITYRLDGAGAALITQPSVVVIVGFETALPASVYARSIVTAKVEIGSQPLLALLTGAGSSWGVSGEAR